MPNERRALSHLTDLLRIEGTSGREGRVADEVERRLRAAGCEAGWIRRDDAPRRLGEGFETGNLIARLPGTQRGPRRLFVGHLDTVPLCRGAVPRRRGGRIVSAGPTGLGADNRTAVACLVSVVETILEKSMAHPPLTFLFSVAEEVGLLGTRVVRKADLGNPRMGFNIDGGDPARLIVGAVGADRWHAEIRGRAAHAGVHPDHGVSAALIASRAIADVSRRGYFGKIRKRGRRGASNVGSLHGGEAANQVTERVDVRGESRSQDPAFLEEITRTWRRAFESAANGVENHRGDRGRVRFRVVPSYAPFRLDADEPVVREALSAARSVGLRPKCVVVDGGLDASRLTERGIPTVTLGAGQHGPHTVDEYADVAEYLKGCRLALRLATASG